MTAEPHAQTPRAAAPSLHIERRSGALTLTLARPEAPNALNPALISALCRAISEAPADAAAILILGQGPSFCAGADLAWMRAGATASAAQRERDAALLAELFDAVAQAPQVVVVAAQGAEVALGLVPATIAPHVLAKIGPGAARAYLLTGATIPAERALALGLVHEVVPAAALLDAARARLDALLQLGPQALRETKALLRALQPAALPPEAARALCQSTLARVRAGAEAEEGCAAFLQRRAPTWRHRP
jgi:methylglutaconyl-CoA hydratase